MNLLIENDLYNSIVSVEERGDLSQSEKEVAINKLYESFFDEYKIYYKIIDIDELIAKIEEIKTLRYKNEHPDEFDMDR